ncbi:flagellar c1a complex subunit c1a-32 domain-containing protein [Phthorimaea operculella]|nr:flagellar c1a complex subunit c1a-32 domain-containing protein [Phthorimaea operculella]
MSSKSPTNSSPKGKQPKKVEPFPSGEPSFTTIQVELKPHYSAPSYLNSLAQNDLPPFKLPSKEPRPCLLAGPPPLVSEDDTVEMIAAADEDPANGMKKFLCGFVVKKGVVNNYDILERNFVVKLLMETTDYAAQRDFNSRKLAMLFNVYLTTHLYFKWYYWSNPKPIWDYFEELMIRHTIECTPDGSNYFEPLECYDIMTHFHTMYISNLPLIHILTFGTHRLRLNWAFNPKK